MQNALKKRKQVFPGRCPLCFTAGDCIGTFDGKQYHICPRCRMIFLNSRFFLKPAEEKKRYETHRNNHLDPAYRRFLNRMLKHLVPRLEQRNKGIDFGSGPGPTMSVMLKERGFPTLDYDPYFANWPERLCDRYHFITCSETVEHFRVPRREFNLFHRLILPGGWLGVMTGTPPPLRDFSRWWYRRDPTHVCFYYPETMRWIARLFGWRLEQPAPGVYLFKVPEELQRRHA